MFGTICFGIFIEGVLLGVAVFGNLMNPKSFHRITDYGKESLIELNRLWISDELGKNAETLFLGACFKIIKKRTLKLNLFSPLLMADLDVVQYTRHQTLNIMGFLTDYEKDVFKTAIEIDQLWLIQHASDRQEYVDQSQSLNLFFSPTVAIEYVAYIHLLAWKMGLKTIYYGRSDALSKVGKLGKSLEREKIAQLQEWAVS